MMHISIPTVLKGVFAMASDAKPAAPKAAAKKAPAAKKPTAKAKAPAKGAVAKAKADPGKTQTSTGDKMKSDFGNFKDQASATARDAADRGKERASEALGGIGKILRESAGTIDDKVGAQYGDYARKAADAVDGFADKVDAKQVEDMVEDARQFVRKSPAIAIGAAAAIGFILARVVRSGRDT
jgi:ElaB/YqjD/DUF883 family membrane-anchored ribosome-binding protein